MRWFKKIVRAVLALLPAFILSMCITNPSYATRHDYDGLFVSNLMLIPTPVLDSDTNSYVLPSSGENWYVGNGLELNLQFSNSVYDVTDINPYLPSYYLNTGSVFSAGSSGGFLNNYTSNCIFYEQNPSVLPFVRLYKYSNATSALVLSNSAIPFDNFTPTSTDSPGLNCLSPSFQASHPVSLFPGGSQLRVWPPLASGQPVQKPYTFFDSIKPYSSNYEGIKLHKTEVSGSDGLTYSHSFSFSRLFDGDQPNKFYSMQIPLASKDGWFTDSSNLYSGRELQFKLLFKFDGSFAWNPDVSQGYSRISAVVLPKNISSVPSSLDTINFDCSNNLVQVTGHTQLEITCNYTLTEDYLAFVPRFQIYNPGYVWDSDSWWEFYGFYLVTDNDETPGSHFNSDLRGDVWSPSDGVGGDGACNDSDIACRLNNLFIFSIPVSNTPLGGILGNFSDQSQCIPIPVIAGMLNSNETQICPWFSSSVRAISTPILSMFSVCLLFGFVVRWLKSSSGDNMLNSHKNGDRD